MKQAGAEGVILRAGQNVWQDEDFKDYQRDAKDAGLPRGYYYFYDSRVDPGKQANVWRAAIAGDLPELGLWCDFEDSYKGPFHGEKYWQQFILAMEAFYPNVKIGIYTANWWWKDQIINYPLFWNKYPLWVAQYTEKPEDVVLPKPWQSCVLWQYTSHGNGTLYGVESFNIDLNHFNGDENKFRSFFGLNIEGEISMDKYKVTWSSGCNKRPEPNVNNTPTGVLPLNFEFEVSTYYVPTGKTPEQERWGQLSDASWVALVYGSQPRAVLVAPPPPSGITLKHKIEVYSDGSLIIDGNPYP